LIHTSLGSCPKNASIICSKVGHVSLVEEKVAPHDIICTQHVRATLLIPISKGRTTLNSVFSVTYYLALANLLFANSVSEQCQVPMFSVNNVVMNCVTSE
jgi:hypothetical protein